MIQSASTVKYLNTYSLSFLMVKYVHIQFDQSDYDKLIKKKGDLAWRDFVLKLI